MVNVKNPNAPCKTRIRAQARKARMGGAKAAKVARWERAGIPNGDALRGARPGLLPTSGPRKALGGKKARRLEHRLAMAARRQMEAEGEVVMRDAAGADKTKKKTEKKDYAGAAEAAAAAADAAMELDIS